jgi:exodeoxyribonuclease VII large subunit
MPVPPPAAEPPKALSVAELDRKLKRIVEGATEDVHVEGEISGLRIHSSGHAYFALKDEQEEACIDCVMYRTAPVRSRKLLSDGARVRLIGRATVYVPRGRLQLVADEARLSGRGALLEALERLKCKLAEEGLFAQERKRPLPSSPSVIGVVTSGDGAAIHDIVKVAFRRGAPRIVLARAPVQGPQAAPRIARALQALARVPEVEVIILGRGGGSAEDLSAYNDEALVRAVAACRVPVVSAIGHEVDMSLTDFVADARAATPSQAAEMLVADSAARAAALSHLFTRMRRAVTHRIGKDQAEIERKRLALGSPLRLIAERQQGIDEALVRLRQVIVRLAGTRRIELQRVERRLAARHPTAVVAGARATLHPLTVRLGAAMRSSLATARRGLAEDMAGLDALSPLSVLARGYAIATTTTGRAVRDAAEVSAGERLSLRVHRGRIIAEVVQAIRAGERRDE